jgi:hypothetical protein
MNGWEEVTCDENGLQGQRTDDRGRKSAVDSGESHRYVRRTNRLSGFVNLHPYFKVPPDKMPYLKAILPEFAAKTRNETGILFYEFTISGDEVFCREGYVNAKDRACTWTM